MLVQSLTSSNTGTFYFAYGSNLSPYQMSRRCPESSTPIAIAKLNSWSWIISERGYANLVPSRPTETSLDTDATTIWGIIYNLNSTDAKVLDGYEGYSEDKRGPPNPNSDERYRKPFEQGEAAYNKMYLLVKIEKWLVPHPRDTFKLVEADYESCAMRTLIYIDEIRLIQGRIKQSYIRRMGRAVRESIPLGIPENWVNRVMCQYGIDKNDPFSFTDEIVPSNDADPPPPRSEWESMREKFLWEEIKRTC